MCVATNCFNAMNAGTMAMFMSIALSEFSTEASIDTPCSVKAKGIYLVPPLFEVAIFDLKLPYSSLLNSNIKSGRIRLSRFF